MLSAQSIGGCPFCGSASCVAGSCQSAKVSPEQVLAFYQKEVERLSRLAQCGSVTSWLALSDEQKREWFAVTAARDTAQVHRIRELEGRLSDLVDAVRQALPPEQQSRQLQAALASATAPDAPLAGQPGQRTVTVKLVQDPASGEWLSK